MFGSLYSVWQGVNPVIIFLLSLYFTKFREKAFFFSQTTKAVMKNNSINDDWEEWDAFTSRKQKFFFLINNLENIP